MNEKERNISWFDNLGKRIITIEQFYSELENLGINYDIGIQSYEHYDIFEFKFHEIEKNISNKDLLKKVLTLTSKYEKLINQTCVDCGEKICNIGTEYLCARCYFTKRNIWNYEDISILGFSYADLDSREFINWNDIASVHFIKEEESFLQNKFPEQIEFKFKVSKIIPSSNDIDFPLIIDKYIAKDWFQNYYNLIKHIPNHLLDEKDKLIKYNLVNHLNDCNICGHKSIYNQNLCLVCGYAGYGRELTERMKKTYSHINEFYRKLQFKYYLELNNKFKYPKRENEFEKSKDYRKLITEKELEEYINRNS